MGDLLSFTDGLAERALGPLSFRLLMQPAVALYFGLRDGQRDAREGRAPYFWALFSDPAHRREMLQSGWGSIGKVFVLAVVLDLVFQWIQFSRVHLAGALVAGVVLAILPYLLLRGPVNRLSRPAGTGAVPKRAGGGPA